jgi:hypothetical protein
VGSGERQHGPTLQVLFLFRGKRSAGLSLSCRLAKRGRSIRKIIDARRFGLDVPDEIADYFYRRGIRKFNANELVFDLAARPSLGWRLRLVHTATGAAGDEASLPACLFRQRGCFAVVPVLTSS